MSPTRTGTTFAPPIIAARRWLDSLPQGMTLVDVSQAAPAAPPPRALREEIARVALEEDAAHLYGPDLGLPDLRADAHGPLTLKGFDEPVTAYDLRG